MPFVDGTKEASMKKLLLIGAAALLLTGLAPDNASAQRGGGPGFRGGGIGMGGVVASAAVRSAAVAFAAASAAPASAAASWAADSAVALWAAVFVALHSTGAASGAR